MAKRPARFSVACERLKEAALLDLFSLRTVGFALSRAWVYLMFLGAAASSITWNGEPAPGIVFVASTIALCATLFTSALFHSRFFTFSKGFIFRLFAPLSTCMGTLLIASTTIPGSPGLALGISGALLTGIGSGLINLGYGEVYRNVDPRKTRFEAPFAFFLAALLFPIVSSLPSFWACIVTSLLPLVSAWILFVKLKTWSRRSAPLVPPFEMRIGKFSWKIGICACLIGLADGIVRAVFMVASDTTVESFYRFPLVFASVMSVAIIYLCVLFSKGSELRSIYKSVMFVMAVFYMLLPVFTSNSIIENTIALAGYGTFNVMIWVLLADISNTFRFSSTVVFGIGWGMVTLGVLLGSLVGQVIIGFAPFAPQSLSLVALVATVAVLVSYMFIFNEDDLIALSQADDTSDSQPKKHRFYDRCMTVADEFKLSPRETEIMILFAKGRSSPRIQEELFISRGTCTTHLRHIYQKLGIHDKQELLDLIEGRLSRD